VPLVGYGWLQLAAFRPGPFKAGGAPPVQLGALSLAVIALLAIFQLVLRPGISF
jgi:hypothetical protein